jgi:hypothetical protein
MKQTGRVILGVLLVALALPSMAEKVTPLYDPKDLPSPAKKAYAVKQEGCSQGFMAHDGNVPIVAKKPVIYLYPPQEEEVSVKLFFHGNLTSAYPPYDVKMQGWKVLARPDGHLVNLADQNEYSYLFWEGTPFKPLGLEDGTGFVVAGKETAGFLQKTLKTLGMTPREYNEFIVFWLPRMEKNAYNLIHFSRQEYTDTACLAITPRPDSVLRVFMLFKPMTGKTDITPQELAPFTRSGFTVVEWGGSELPK